MAELTEWQRRRGVVAKPKPAKKPKAKAKKAKPAADSGAEQ